MPRTISDKEPFFCFNGFLSVTQGDTGMILATQPLHPALSELNSRALSELVWQYCFGDDCEAELIKAYHLNCEPEKLLKVLPLIQAEWVCPYCQHHPDFLWDYLSEKGLITLSPCTDPSAFTIADNKVQGLNYRAARWKIFLESFDVSLLQLINRIESATWPPK